jgi:hypothetical protein
VNFILRLFIYLNSKVHLRELLLFLLFKRNNFSLKCQLIHLFISKKGAAPKKLFNKKCTDLHEQNYAQRGNDIVWKNHSTSTNDEDNDAERGAEKFFGVNLWQKQKGSEIDVASFFILLVRHLRWEKTYTTTHTCTHNHSSENSIPTQATPIIYISSFYFLGKFSLFSKFIR